MFVLGVRTTSEVLLSEAMKKGEELIEKEKRCGLGGKEKKTLKGANSALVPCRKIYVQLIH